MTSIAGDAAAELVAGITLVTGLLFLLLALLRMGPSFRAEWQRLTPAREFAATLLRYRAEHDLSQRALAKKLGVSQPRVVKLESGEHNPVRAQKRGAIAHDDVSVVAASSV